MKPEAFERIIRNIETAYSRGLVTFDRLKRSYRVANLLVYKSEDTNE